MKKIWVFTIIMVLASFGVSAIANYGDYNYGAGEYGENTPPVVSAFQPSSGTPTLNQSANVTFNVTYVDYDGDTITLSWYVNGTINTTNTNLSYIFNNLGKYNISAELADTWDTTTQQWLVSVEVIITTANLTDVLIVPRITTDGNVIIITANVTAIDQNAQGVYAYLNLPQGSTILNTITPQNQSLGTVYTNNVTEIQWILSTPLEPSSINLNISYVHDSGNFEGENEAILITQQENTMGIAVALLLMFVIASYFFLIWIMSSETFSSHALIKVSIITAGVWFLLIPVTAAIRIWEESGGSAQLLGMLNSFYSVLVYVNVAVTCYMVFFLAVGMIRSMNTGSSEKA